MKSAFRSRAHPGYWGFIVHRVSGLLLALFLPLHFWLLSQALHGPAALDGAGIGQHLYKRGCMLLRNGWVDLVCGYQRCRQITHGAAPINLLPEPGATRVQHQYLANIGQHNNGAAVQDARRHFRAAQHAPLVQLDERYRGFRQLRREIAVIDIEADADQQPFHAVDLYDLATSKTRRRSFLQQVSRPCNSSRSFYAQGVLARAAAADNHGHQILKLFMLFCRISLMSTLGNRSGFQKIHP